MRATDKWTAAQAAALARGDDPQRYRVTRICKCGTDYAHGYGPTIADARTTCAWWWKRDKHRIRDIAVEVVEEWRTNHWEEIA